MSRNVESVHQFRHEPKFRLSKDMTVVRCGDGTVYEFEKPTDEPDGISPTLTRAYQPDGSVTHTGSRAILPDAVEETVETLLGGWSK